MIYVVIALVLFVLWVLVVLGGKQLQLQRALDANAELDRVTDALLEECNKHVKAKYAGVQDQITALLEERWPDDDICYSTMHNPKGDDSITITVPSGAKQQFPYTEFFNNFEQCAITIDGLLRNT